MGTRRKFLKDAAVGTAVLAGSSVGLLATAARADKKAGLVDRRKDGHPMRAFEVPGKRR